MAETGLAARLRGEALLIWDLPEVWVRTSLPEQRKAQMAKIKGAAIRTIPTAAVLMTAGIVAIRHYTNADLPWGLLIGAAALITGTPLLLYAVYKLSPHPQRCSVALRTTGVWYTEDQKAPRRLCGWRQLKAFQLREGDGNAMLRLQFKGPLSRQLDFPYCEETVTPDTLRSVLLERGLEQRTA